MGRTVTHFISSPAESYEDLRAWEELYATLPKVYWFNQSLARHVTEFLPGETCGVIGRTGNGKTALLLAQAHHEAKHLIAQGKATTHFVCYYTRDQPKEALEKRLRRAMQADKGKYGLTSRMELPLWFVGKGIMDARESGYERIPLTVEVMEQTLNDIVKFDKQTEKNPSLLIVDYLQRVQGKNEDDISNQVRRIANALSDFASTYNVPVLIGAQAGRDTDRQLDKTPLMGSSRHSAEFEDMVDKLLAIWRPVTSEKRGSVIDVAGRPYVVDDDLMKVIKWKDREGTAHVPFAFPFNMETLKSGEYES